MIPRSFLLAAAGFSAAFGATIPSPSVTLNGNQVITGAVKDNVESFKGIPFANPPLGDLRFKLPTDYTGNYQGLQANDYRSSCMQIDPNKIVSALGTGIDILSTLPDNLKGGAFQSLRGAIKMSEDCLYLNVLRPPGTKDTDKLPVMVWIYGGAFLYGSTAAYPGEPFVKESIKMNQPVIFVSIAYRLGPFGFLGGADIAAEGNANAGLYDQRKGLEWVQDNIAKFGGDPEKVMLFGESAGAMSVAAQLVAFNGDNTYKGKPLFHSAIMQSGGPLPLHDNLSAKPAGEYQRFLEHSGCGGQKGANALSCLRSKSTSVLADALNSYPSEELFGIYPTFLGYTPRTDGKFLTDDPYTLFKQNKVAQVPIISGNMEDEGTMFALLNLNATNTAETTGWLQYFLPDVPASSIGKILSLYPENPADGCPFRTGRRNALTSQYKRFAAMISDLMFFSPRRVVLENSTQKRWTYFSSALYNIVPYLGSFHSADTIFQFQVDVSPSKPFLKHWIAFANSHDPNTGTGLPHWDDYTPENKNMLEITWKNQFMRKDDMRPDQITFFATEPNIRL